MFQSIFLPELMGTAILLLMGCGVVANVALQRTKGADGSFLMVCFGWGLAVFAGVYVANESGAHINPAVTLGLVASGAGISFVEVLVYLSAQMLGAIIGAVLCWLAYRDQFDDAESDADSMLAVFSTAPEVRRTASNLLTEAIGTFVLVFVVLSFAPADEASGRTPAALGALSVALLVVGIGASLGGPTGYAINPARDLGPRIAHALLPMKGKGPSDWGYAWVPVAGPIAGGVAAGLLARVVGYV